MTQTQDTARQSNDSRTPDAHTTDPILVLGASGKTGRRIISRLQSAGRDVRAASRSSTVRFDWEDNSTWPSALEGITTVYIALPLTPVPIHEFIRLAVAAGVQRMVALSGRGADTWDGFGQEMVDLEQAVRGSGVTWTVLRSSNFAQNFDEDAFAEGISAGELALPVGGVPEAFVDVEDVADVAVALLTTDDWAGQVVEVSGPEAIPWHEAVAAISRTSGRAIRFTDVPPGDYPALLAAQGLPEADVEALVTMFAEMRRGLLTEPADGIQEVLGRDPRPFADYVARAAAAGAWA